MKSIVIVECSTVHALVYFYFPANGLMNPDFFSPKTSAPPGESSLKIKNFGSLGLAVSEESGLKLTGILLRSKTVMIFVSR